MLSKTGGIYLLYMKTRNYYKLPGGGIDPGESIESALHRELMEECGTDGDIIAEVGSIEELREMHNTHQISYCYVVHQKGGHVLPDYEEGEQEDGAESMIAKNIDEAIALVENAVPVDDEVRFIQHRDAVLLKEAKRLLNV